MICVALRLCEAVSSAWCKRPSKNNKRFLRAASSWFFNALIAVKWLLRCFVDNASSVAMESDKADTRASNVLKRFCAGVSSAAG
jgi:hypothetical protein